MRTRLDYTLLVRCWMIVVHGMLHEGGHAGSGRATNAGREARGEAHRWHYARQTITQDKGHVEVHSNESHNNSLFVHRNPARSFGTWRK